MSETEYLISEAGVLIDEAGMLRQMMKADTKLSKATQDEMIEIVKAWKRGVCCPSPKPRCCNGCTVGLIPRRPVWTETFTIVRRA